MRKREKEEERRAIIVIATKMSNHSRNRLKSSIGLRKQK